MIMDKVRRQLADEQKHEKAVSIDAGWGSVPVMCASFGMETVWKLSSLDRPLDIMVHVIGDALAARLAEKVDWHAAASAIAGQLRGPEINLGQTGLLDVMIRHAVQEALSKSLSEVGDVHVWVAPDVYRRRYGLSRQTQWRYARDGLIPRDAIRGCGKGRRYNITVPPRR